MAKSKMSGLLVNGSVRSAGVTFYTSKGQTIVRTSRSNQPERRTRAQFDVRMRVRHSAALWQALKAAADPLLGRNAYARFRSLAFSLPVVYVARYESNASMLMPGMPVSEGSLPPVGLRLGTVDGVAALLTDLSPSALKANEFLLLYTVHQDVVNDVPRCRVSAESVAVSDMVVVDGCLALTGAEFGDDMNGWALVRVEPANANHTEALCSTQTIVTRCTYYQRFTTPEAFDAAILSYGGLK